MKQKTKFEKRMEELPSWKKSYEKTIFQIWYDKKRGLGWGYPRKLNLIKPEELIEILKNAIKELQKEKKK